MSLSSILAFPGVDGKLNDPPCWANFVVNTMNCNKLTIDQTELDQYLNLDILRTDIETIKMDIQLCNEQLFELSTKSPISQLDKQQKQIITINNVLNTHHNDIERLIERRASWKQWAYEIDNSVRVQHNIINNLKKQVDDQQKCIKSLSSQLVSQQEKLVRMQKKHQESMDELRIYINDLQKQINKK